MQTDWKQSSRGVGNWVWTWVWWALEQFSVLFMPKPSVTNEAGELVPCPTCWWYRGLLFGFSLGLVFSWVA